MNTPTSAPPETPQGNPDNAAVDSMGRPLASPGARRKSDKNLGILTLAMFAAGIFLMAWSAYEIKGSNESRNWPRTQGTITSSSISEQTRRDSSTRRNKTTYYPRVLYEYQVKGRHYTSHRIEFGGESGGMKWMAKRVVDKYPSGKKVTVYYKPQDPQYGILEAGFTWKSLFILLAGMAFFAAGVLCFKTYRKQQRKRQTVQPPYFTGDTGG